MQCGAVVKFDGHRVQEEDGAGDLAPNLASRGSMGFAIGVQGRKPCFA